MNSIYHRLSTNSKGTLRPVIFVVAFIIPLLVAGLLIFPVTPAGPPAAAPHRWR